MTAMRARAAQLAYLETSLQLTATERPLFQRWKDAKLNIAHRHADTCAQRATQRGASARQARSADAQDRSDSMRGPARPTGWRVRKIA